MDQSSRTDSRNAFGANPIKEYTIPSNNSGPLAIISGAKGTYWFTEFGDPIGGKIGEFFSSNSSFKDFTIPETGAKPAALARDKFGNIWVSDQSGSGSIWKLNPYSSQFVQYKIPTANSTPLFVLIDPDTNNVWFTELLGNKIGELAYPNYAMTEFSPPTPNSGPAEMILNESAATLWITETYASQLAALNINSHSFQEFKPSVSLNSPIGIVLDSTGNVWISEHGGSSIVEFNPTTAMWKKFPTSAPPPGLGYDRSAPATLAIDSNGNLWFVEHFSNKVGILNPHTGEMQEFVIPTLGAYSVLNDVDPQGNFWFTQFSANQIGMMPGNTTTSLSLHVIGNHSDLVTASAGQPVKVAFNISNAYSQTLDLRLNTSSSFSSNGVASIGGVLVNTSSLQVAPGQSNFVQATITPDDSLPSGNYAVGITASYGNSSVVGYVFLQVQGNPFSLSSLETYLPMILGVVAIALISALFLLRMRRSHSHLEAKAPRTHHLKVDNSRRIWFFFSLAIIVAVAVPLAPSILHIVSSGLLLVAQGKCPGIPQYQNQAPDWFTYTLDGATLAVVGLLAFVLIRDYHKGRSGKKRSSSEETASGSG